MTPSTNLPFKIVIAACFGVLLAACNSDGSTGTSSATSATGDATSTSETPPATSSVGTVAAGGGGAKTTTDTGSSTTSTTTASTGPATSTGAAVGDGPTISGTPATTVTVGATYNFTPIASDATSTALTFAISGKPVWATFNPQTGALSGVPAAANVGASAAIAISVSDGIKSVSLAPFTISVVAAAAADDLAITGTPSAKATVGTAYTFIPAATDVEGSKLTYSIVNKPVWATFSTANGLLSGTPATANIGVDSEIEISVTDGEKTVALPAFAITVAAPATDSVTLSWTAPTLNVNGSAVTDLAGYHIHYGTSATNLSTVVAVTGSSDTQHVISNLQPGTWYFAVTSFNSQNVESPMSAVLTVAL